MNCDEIGRLAAECGVISWVKHEWSKDQFVHTDEGMDGDFAGLCQFAALVAAAERERACRIVTGLCISDNNAHEINTKIREGNP
jgi:hypothetical protein